jgi:DNA-binding MarR family transcriptional regulator
MSTPDPATQVWALMQAFVDANGARAQIRQHLGPVLGTGRGKIKTLLLLADAPRSLGEIANALAVDRPYATVLVDQLEGMGLVQRTTDTADRRRKLVSLMPVGEQTAATARNLIQGPPAPLAALTSAELAQLGAILAKLTDQHN